MSCAFEASLLDVLIDGFEKNESVGGFYARTLPLPDETAALLKFNEFAHEGRRWKGEPVRSVHESDRRFVAWPDLQIGQAGRGVLVLVRDPNFTPWWHADGTWDGEPLGDVWSWLSEGARSRAPETQTSERREGEGSLTDAVRQAADLFERWGLVGHQRILDAKQAWLALPAVIAVRKRRP